MKKVLIIVFLAVLLQAETVSGKIAMEDDFTRWTSDALGLSGQVIYGDLYKWGTGGTLESGGLTIRTQNDILAFSKSNMSAYLKDIDGYDIDAIADLEIEFDYMYYEGYTYADNRQMGINYRTDYGWRCIRDASIARGYCINLIRGPGDNQDQVLVEFRKDDLINNTNNVLVASTTVTVPGLVWGGWIHVKIRAEGNRHQVFIENNPAACIDIIDDSTIVSGQWNLRDGGGARHRYIDNLKYHVLNVPDLLDDDFNASDLNAQLWVDTSDPCSVINFQYSQLILDANGGGSGYPAGIISKKYYWTHPVSDEKLVFLIKNLRGPDNGSGVIRGDYFKGVLFNNSSSAKTQMGISSYNPDPGQLRFVINDASSGFVDYCMLQNDIVGTWKLVWEENRVRIYKQAYDETDFELVFDSEVNSGVGGTGAGEWVIPKVSLGAFLQSNWDGYGPVRVDRVYFGPPQCGEEGFLKMDMNEDCYLDVIDLKILADEWLKSTNPDDTSAYDLTQPTTVYAPLGNSVTIDGVKSHGEWDDANVYYFDATNPGMAPGITGAGRALTYPIEVIAPEDISATMYVKVDSDYLYIGIEVFDDEIQYNNTNYLWINDSVELYFDFDNSNTVGYLDADDPNFGLQLTALCVADPAYGDLRSRPIGAEDWWTARGTWPISHDSGKYFVEFRIDLDKTPLYSGGVFGFDVAVNDVDTYPYTTRDNVLGYKDACWYSESSWSDIILQPGSGCGTLGYFEVDLNKDDDEDV